jgi:parvulin-like peptidyl-prolyl isomerase
MEEQDVSEEVYRHDAVWPSVALKKLVGANVEVSDEDLRKGYEANYGQQVRCRAILLNNMRRAQEVFELARQNPTVENFGRLAEEYSIDAGTRVLRGEIPPIRRFGGQPELEKEAFALQPGQVSGIVQVGPDTYVLLFCEGYTEPRQADFNEVRQFIYDDVHEKKLRIAMAQEFRKLQDASRIDNFLEGTSKSPAPAKTAGPAPLSVPGNAEERTAAGGLPGVRR